jgi:pimeloyl-ACP methyl ester carboxylesterase
MMAIKFGKRQRQSHSIMLLILAWVFAGSDFVIAKEPEKPWLIHLPGIAGERNIDRGLITGLGAGGIKAEFEIYDWTGDQKGLGALQNEDRHTEEAKNVAERLTRRFRNNPQLPIYLTAHSAGTGIAVWALEQLPDDVKIESLVMLAPALSPQYDLSRALKHVKKKVYVFASEYDNVVLGTGTKVFGTVDGVKSEAAGLNGFIQPNDADIEEYRKLCPQPYDLAWGTQYGNVGSHISCMKLSFAREYIAVLLRTGSPPVIVKAVTTQPSKSIGRPTTQSANTKTAIK